MNGTPQQKLFDGRMEKRLSMSVTAYLARANDHLAREQTVTENMSPHGARVVTKQYWRSGEEVILTPTGEFPQLGKVVYCKKTGDHFCLGLELPGRSLKWEDYRRIIEKSNDELERDRQRIAEAEQDARQAEADYAKWQPTRIPRNEK